MADRSPQAVDDDGVTLTFNAAAAGGDTMLNENKRTMLFVRNSHATDARTVTIAAVQTTRDGQGVWPEMTLANLAVVVAAQTTVAIGPLPSAFNHATSKWLQLTYTNSGADLAIAGMEFPA
jgi:hypothetical protein